MALRVCVVGGGLAGALLTWRLAGAGPPDLRLDLVAPGPAGGTGTDATAASGGAVRAYDPDPRIRRLATASLAELLASPTLRRWAGWEQVRSVYAPAGAAGHEIDAAVAEIEADLPGSAHRVDGEVHERLAGYLSPARLRGAVLAELAAGGRVRLREAPVTAVAPGAGAPAVTVAGKTHWYDVVVLATGAWTGRLLAGGGLPGRDYRTKSIQYRVCRVAGGWSPDGWSPDGWSPDGWSPHQFVDEPAGVYGRPDPDGLLLGVPTDQWGVDPDRPPLAPALHAAAVARVRARYPRLRLGPVVRAVGAVDCYPAGRLADPPTLCLRPVPDRPGLHTFTAGAGGAVKTALAASSRAATALLGPVTVTSVPREGATS